MADEDQLKLTQDQRNLIAEGLTKKGARHPCPACGMNQWLVGEHLIRADVFSSGGTILGGPSYPLAFVVCQNCFFLRPHLAMPLGVVPPQPTQASDPVGSAEPANG